MSRESLQRFTRDCAGPARFKCIAPRDGDGIQPRFVGGSCWEIFTQYILRTGADCRFDSRPAMRCPALN
jgi:hypothetical protein